MSRMSQAERKKAAQILINRYGEAGRRLLATKVPPVWAKNPGERGEVRVVDASATVSSSAIGTAALASPPFAVRVLNHLTFGATASSIAQFNALGTTDTARLTAFVDQQLFPGTIPDVAIGTMLTAANGFDTLSLSLSDLWRIYRRETKLQPGGDPRPALETQLAALVRAVHSKRQLFEMTASFWHDHFNVYFQEPVARTVFTQYARNVIRPHVFGNFRVMLEAVAKSTSMMFYLDNYSSTVAGPNENFARELIELYTLGADNYFGHMSPLDVPDDAEDPAYPAGYVDSDVYATAEALTGWSVKNGHPSFPLENDGTFVYRPEWHDDYPKLVLGVVLPAAQADMKDGRDILDRLASHPKTARFICTKLIRRFVSDVPPPALVTSAAKVFRDNWTSPDQIKRTLRHILLSAELQTSWGNKIRRPYELLVAALRTTGSDWAPKYGDAVANAVVLRTSATGHGTYEWQAPNGYADVAPAWQGTNSMATSWRLLNGLPELMKSSTSTENLLPILAVTRAELPVAQWTATKLVDFWCERVLGYLPAPSRRDALIKFMAQNGDPNAYVIADNNVPSPTDLKKHFNQGRIRGMVSLVMMTPEFASR